MSMLVFLNLANSSEASDVTGNIQVAHDTSVLAWDEVAVTSNKKGDVEGVKDSPADCTVRVNNENDINNEDDANSNKQVASG